MQDHLEEVLDRFAQFFVAPLCLKSAIDRELTAVSRDLRFGTQKRRIFAAEVLS